MLDHRNIHFVTPFPGQFLIIIDSIMEKLS